MKTSSQILIGVTSLVVAMSGLYVDNVFDSSELAGEQMEVLRPIIHRWNSFPVDERERSGQRAEDYGSLSSDMQRRVSEPLLTWTTLGAAERSAARGHLRELRALPPDKRRELINRWKKQHLG